MPFSCTSHLLRASVPGATKTFQLKLLLAMKLWNTLNPRRGTQSDALTSNLTWHFVQVCRQHRARVQLRDRTVWRRVQHQALRRVSSSLARHGRAHQERVEHRRRVALQVGLEVARVERRRDDALRAVAPVQLVREEHVALRV